MLDKTYRPTDVEERRYAWWEASGGFAAHPDGCLLYTSDAADE